MFRKKYCTALTKTNSRERLIGDCEEYYICGITQHPCIAREIKQTYTKTSPLIWIYGEAIIDEEKLPDCPSWNLPKKKVKELARLRLEINVEKTMVEIK